MSTWVTLGAVLLIPLLLMVTTSYVKFAVVLTILRNAFGIAQVPSGTVIAAIAILLSLYVMAPVGEEIVDATRDSVARIDPNEPFVGDSFAAVLESIDLAEAPLSAFLVANSGERERTVFLELARDARSDPDIEERDLLVALPSFLITELGEAFAIGFLLFVPFLVLDLVIASILLTLGMQQSNATAVSLPFKLLLFVATDGWVLLSQALVSGYA